MCIRDRAIYDNSLNSFLIGVINYDKFISSLDHIFQRGRKRCDLIVFTANSDNYLLLNELKDSNKSKSVQLVSSLEDLMKVEQIKQYAGRFIVRRCCLFNKRVPISPSPINATLAFNRVNPIAKYDFQIENSDIEKYGFTYHKYYGGYQFRLV